MQSPDSRTEAQSAQFRTLKCRSLDTEKLIQARLAPDAGYYSTKRKESLYVGVG